MHEDAGAVLAEWKNKKRAIRTDDSLFANKKHKKVRKDTQIMHFLLRPKRTMGRETNETKDVQMNNTKERIGPPGHNSVDHGYEYNTERLSFRERKREKKL